MGAAFVRSCYARIAGGRRGSEALKDREGRGERGRGGRRGRVEARELRK